MFEKDYWRNNPIKNSCWSNPVKLTEEQKIRWHKLAILFGNAGIEPTRRNKKDCDKEDMESK